VTVCGCRTRGVGEVLVVVEQREKGKRGGVVEAPLGGPLQDRVRALVDLGDSGCGGEDCLLGRREDGVHAAQDEQGQHDRAVLVLLERPPQRVGDLPDEGHLVLKPQRCHQSPWPAADASVSVQSSLRKPRRHSRLRSDDLSPEECYAVGGWSEAATAIQSRTCWERLGGAAANSRPSGAYRSGVTGADVPISRSSVVG